MTDNKTNITNTTTYAYDSANQLIRENNPAAGETYTWTYDNAGNITNRSFYYYTAGELGGLRYAWDYGYNDSDIGDLNTHWNGRTFEYDEIGNLVNDGDFVYTWEHGRQMARMSASTTWTFSYDADGMRTGRTDGTRTYSYIYNGSSLSRMIANGHVLDFFYDASGSPLALTFDGTPYYYALNLQGDVVAILDGAGNAVVSYVYDAWGYDRGCSGSLSGTLGYYNPLRYRGYVYDVETGLYYLQSRYYNGGLCRFNAPDAYASTGQGILGNNMFAYCGNNPTGYTDERGMLPKEARSDYVRNCLDAAGGAVPLIVTYGLGWLLQQFGRTVATFADKALADVYSFSRAIREQITERKANRPHVHHIVPVGAFSSRTVSTYNKVKELHQVLEAAGVNRVIDPMNLILVSSKTHASLHTDKYIAHVYEYIMATDGSKSQIYAMLFFLRLEIAAWDKHAIGY